jgi:D-aminoacyl-tRNA deacylase
MNTKILYWTKNPAAQNIMKQFNELGVDVEVFETEKDFLYLTDEDINGAQGRRGAGAQTDLLIFPSTHKSAANKKSLTIHATGNFGNADYGGEPKKLNPTSSEAIAIGLRSMANQALGSRQGAVGFEVCLEVTHHGPTIKTPLVFIEIGSTEEEWGNVEAGKVIANAIKDIIEYLKPPTPNPKPFTNYIGFGGPHYAPSFTKKIIENENIAIGHILPKYQQDNVTKDIIQQMLDGSNAKKAVFDWDGMNSEQRNKAVGILDELGIEWCKTKELV